MRSFYCEKCRLEFDLDEDFDEDDNTVFCPQCKINLARMLPETPERILMREKRLREARKKQRRASVRFVSGTLGLLILFNILLLTGGRSFFWMLVAGLIAGIPAGLWTRRITADRTFRAGLLAVLLTAVIAGLNIAALHFGTGMVIFPAFRNLFGAVITAWIFAVFEKS